MERLGENARRTLAAAGVPSAAPLAELVRRWPELVGPAVARAAWPARLGRDGTLHVTTASSTWAFELDRLAPELLGRLRAALGPDAPGGLRFAPGPVPAAERADAPVAPPPQPTNEEVSAAAAAAAAIEDEELRELAARAAAAAFAAARSRRPV